MLLLLVLLMSLLFPPESKLWKENREYEYKSAGLDRGSLPSKGKTIVEYGNFNLLQNITEFRGEKCHVNTSTQPPRRTELIIVALMSLGMTSDSF